jgi:type I restriction enzyme S subunit
MEMKEEYRQTEVGVIPSDWDIKPLREISSLKGRIGWQGLKQTEFTMNPNEPYLITGMNFKDGEIRWDEVYHISIERYEVAKEIQLRLNDLLMTKDGTIGKLLFINTIPYPGSASLNSHLLLFRPIRNSYYPKFLYYQLASKAFKDYIEISKSGSTFFGISQEAVGEYKAFLPTIIEQTAIASALSDSDALISRLEELIAKKRNIKQGAMQELLTGKKRLPWFSGKWEVKKLGEICGKITTGKLDANAMVENGEYRFYTCAKEYYWIDRYAFDTEALLVSGNGANVGYIHHYRGKFNAYQRTYVLFDFLDDILFIKLFMDRNLQNRIRTEVNAGNTPYIKMDTLAEMEIKIPPTKAEQAAIAKILSDMDAEIEQLEQKLDKYRMIKQGMMQQLLTGKIRLL